MPAAIAHSPVVCQMTYRAANNPYVDKRIKDSRFRYGVRLFAPKGGDGARELLDGLARGESVALMNDQKFNGGVAAPLFGQMAHTAPGPGHNDPIRRWRASPAPPAAPQAWQGRRSARSGRKPPFPGRAGTA